MSLGHVTSMVDNRLSAALEEKRRETFGGFGHGGTVKPTFEKLYDGGPYGANHFGTLGRYQQQTGRLMGLHSTFDSEEEDRWCLPRDIPAS
eukprot:gene1700-2357_t